MAKRKKKEQIIVVVLDEESQALLRELAVHENVYCHHLTMAYKPDVATLRKYQDLVGKHLTLIVTGIAQDEKSQAVSIPAVRSEKKYPHITVSCVEGTEPNHSNELLECASNSVTIEPLVMQLSGVVCVMSLQQLQTLEKVRKEEGERDDE